jgi:hypothetical protein
MAMLRRDQHSTGDGSAVLAWAICVACRHVRLDHWAFVDEIGTDQKGHDRRNRA